MSYESKMLREFLMPTQKEVGNALLRTLFWHGGTIKEFGGGEEIVAELADTFELDDRQRAAFLETTYRKENRKKKSYLWHRLLFRAADALSREKLVSRPSETARLTKKREWMLTEKGFDKAMTLCKIPALKKESLPVKSYEVQKVVKQLTEAPPPEDYNPIDASKRIVQVTSQSALRKRGFRQAIIEAYDFRCAVCGFKMPSPDSLTWEVEAAHIVPNRSLGKDDVWNGIAFCHLHHWAFDVGWFTLSEGFRIDVSPSARKIPPGLGKIDEHDFLGFLSRRDSLLVLPERREIYPHLNAIRWHRKNVFEPANLLK